MKEDIHQMNEKVTHQEEDDDDDDEKKKIVRIEQK